MMDEHQQRMCETQGELFELAAETLPCSSAYFISRFMYSEEAKDMDLIESLYNHLSPMQRMDGMLKAYGSLTKKKGEVYPRSVLHWMGYIYRAWSILTRKTSSEIYKKMKAKRLYGFYDVYHTFAPEYAVERLEEILTQEEGPRPSDYEVYKAISEGRWR